MARYLGPACKLCRREGAKLFLKGTKCTTDKCPFNKRTYAPGQHGQRRTKLSDYGLQLREKQKVKRIYGVLEKQFRLYFQRAAQSKAVTGEKLLELLERRLDNVIFRSCFASSRRQSRQMVNHGLVYVNGRRVDIVSFMVKKGDTVAIKDKEHVATYVKNTLEATEERGVVRWIEADFKKLNCVIKDIPTRDDIQFPIQEQLIVELYSK